MNRGKYRSVEGFMNWRDRSSGGLVVLRVGVVVHNTFHLGA